MARITRQGRGSFSPLRLQQSGIAKAMEQRRPVAIGYSSSAALFALALALPAHADTFKCMDANGRATYTNIKEETKGKKCTLVMREISIVPALPKAGAPAAAREEKEASSPRGFPKVDRASQKQRDDDRRRILQEELGAEQDALAQAKEELARQESIRNGDERNYQRVLDRLQRYKDDVERHEKNVAALKKELDNVK